MGAATAVCREVINQGNVRALRSAASIMWGLSMQSLPLVLRVALFSVVSLFAPSNAYSLSPAISSQVQSCLSFSGGSEALSSEGEQVFKNSLELAARGRVSWVRVEVNTEGKSSVADSAYVPSPEVVELTMVRTSALQIRFRNFLQENRAGWSFSGSPGGLVGEYACEAFLTIYFRNSAPVCSTKGSCVSRCSKEGCTFVE
jgi:hypothetical protein